MPSKSSPTARKHSDFTKLLMTGYRVDVPDDNTQDFYVAFHGPKDTAYESGLWKVHVTLPDNYPFSPPSIGFANKILHPNVDEASGSVCLDVINQTWTPLYSLVNIFEIFLPQLLTYPNPTDPLNSDAAALFLRDQTKYNEKVRAYVKLYAGQEVWPQTAGGGKDGPCRSDSVGENLLSRAGATASTPTAPTTAESPSHFLKLRFGDDGSSSDGLIENDDFIDDIFENEIVGA